MIQEQQDTVVIEGYGLKSWQWMIVLVVGLAVCGWMIQSVAGCCIEMNANNRDILVEEAKHGVIRR